MSASRAPVDGQGAFELDMPAGGHHHRRRATTSRRAGPDPVAWLAQRLRLAAHAWAARERDPEPMRGRMLRIATWLDEHRELPGERIAWPCQLCPAEPGEPCEHNPQYCGGDVDGRAWLHSGRGWTIGSTLPGSRPLGSDEPELGPHENLTERCSPTVEHVLGWMDAMTYRGRCLGCSWRGGLCDEEGLAVEDAHDHAWPGWRDLPTSRPAPDNDGGGAGTARGKKAARKYELWLSELRETHPEGWLEAGGPMITERTPGGTRHVPGRAPGGGYDLARIRLSG